MYKFKNKKEAFMIEPTPAEIHELAPKVNMLFALSMVLESLATDIEHKVMHTNSANLRHFVAKVTPDVAEQFGDWADYVESEIMKLSANKWELASIVIVELRQLSFDVQNFYRRFDKKFNFIGNYEIKQLYSIKYLRYSKSIGKDFRKLIEKLIVY